jgi:hypothetical protein
MYCIYYFLIFFFWQYTIFSTKIVVLSLLFSFLCNQFVYTGHAGREGHAETSNNKIKYASFFSEAINYAWCNIRRILIWTRTPCGPWWTIFSNCWIFMGTCYYNTPSLLDCFHFLPPSWDIISTSLTSTLIFDFFFQHIHSHLHILFLDISQYL